MAWLYIVAAPSSLNVRKRAVQNHKLWRRVEEGANLWRFCRVAPREHIAQHYREYGWHFAEQRRAGNQVRRAEGSHVWTKKGQSFDPQNCVYVERAWTDEFCLRSRRVNRGRCVFHHQRRRIRHDGHYHQAHVPRRICLHIRRAGGRRWQYRKRKTTTTTTTRRRRRRRRRRSDVDAVTALLQQPVPHGAALIILAFRLEAPFF